MKYTYCNTMRSIAFGFSLFILGGYVLANDRVIPGADTGWEFDAFLGYSKSASPLSGSEHVGDIEPYIDIVYTGENFFFSLYNTTIGYSFINRPRYSLSAIFTPTSDAIYFFESGYDFKNKLGSRNFSTNAGLEIFFFNPWGDVMLHSSRDVSQVHNGYDMQLIYALPSLDKEFWRIDSRLGIIHSSKKILNYYYGIRDNEVSVKLPAYSAGSGTSVYIQLEFNYQMTEFWQLKAISIYEKLPNAISNSPLVDKSSLFTFYIGLGHEW